MLSTIIDYKPINEQDIGMKIESENHNWSSFSDKKQTYIRAKLVSVETQIAYSEELDPEEGHFQREGMHYSYLLTFQEGPELKTYPFSEKPTDFGQYYLYTIKNNNMVSCYRSEKGFKNNIANRTTDIEIFFYVLFLMFVLLFIFSLFINPLFSPFMITVAVIFSSSLGLNYLIRKKSSNLANKIIAKLKKNKQ